MAVALFVALAQSAAALQISVVGSKLVDAGGHQVLIHGVNRSDVAYACIGNSPSPFQGPTDQPSVTALLTWNVNAIRLTLNEDCWLGINGAPAAASGANYRNAVVAYVNMLEASGVYVDLTLQWNAPGSFLSNSQEPEADDDHAPAFWQSVTATFANDRGTMFNLYNEPYASYQGSQATAMTWSCWQNGGCTVHCDQATAGGSCPTGTAYAVAGMGPLINVIRAQEGTGWHHPIILAGLGSSNDLSSWLTNRPTDSAGQEIAGYHWYNDNAGGCVLPTTNSCWTNLATINQSYPLIGDEFGSAASCNWTPNMPPYLTFMTNNSSGFDAWVWNASASCSSEPSLVTNYNGTATSYGQNYKTFLLPSGRVNRLINLPPGAALPTDATCTTLANQANFPEGQPGNVNDGTGWNANNQIWTTPSYFYTNAGRNGLAPAADFAAVDGNYSGTTQDIIRWAACKWGVDEGWAYAETAEETGGWTNACAQMHGGTTCAEGGDCGNFDSDSHGETANLSFLGFTVTNGTSTFVGPNAFGGANENGQSCPSIWSSWSIIQSKARFFEWYTWPMLAISTAWGEDYRWAKWRACVNGDYATWFGNNADYLAAVNRARSNPNGLVPGGQTGPTNLFTNETNLQYVGLGCVGTHFSGSWYDSGSISYLSSGSGSFISHLNNSNWPGQPVPNGGPTPTPGPTSGPTQTPTQTPVPTQTPTPGPSPTPKPNCIVITSPGSGGTVSGNSVAVGTDDTCAGLWFENLLVDGTHVGSYVPGHVIWDSTTASNGTHTVQVNSQSQNPGSVTLGSASEPLNVQNFTPTPTSTPTATQTLVPTPTPTPTNSPTASPTPTGATQTPTQTPTNSPTPTPTPTNSPTQSPTQTAVPTKMPTAVSTPLPTRVPTSTPTVAVTALPGPTPTACPAQHIFVDPAGSDSLNDGKTTLTPFQTVGYAVNQVQACGNATVFVKSGSYAEDVVMHTSGAPFGNFDLLVALGQQRVLLNSLAPASNWYIDDSICLMNTGNCP